MTTFFKPGAWGWSRPPPPLMPILGEIRRLFRDGGTVKVSRSLKELGLAAGRVRELLGSELGREATIAEVAGRMNRTPEEVAQALAATTPPLSLTGGEEDGSDDETA